MMEKMMLTMKTLDKWEISLRNAIYGRYLEVGKMSSRTKVLIGGP